MILETGCYCIRIFIDGTTFNDAGQRCGTFGEAASLAPVESENSYDQIQLYLTSIGIKDAWIGTNAEGSSSMSTSNQFLKNRVQWLGDIDRERMKAEELSCIAVDNGHLMLSHCANQRPFLCAYPVSCTEPTTPKPYPTMNPVEKVVAQVVQTVGCTFVVGVLSATLAAFTFLRNFCLERMIMMSEEASLLAAHLLIMTARDNYGSRIACVAVALSLHYFFLVYFTALLMESLQTYYIVSSVIPNGGFIPLKFILIIIWVVPAGVVGGTGALYYQDYITRIMCFLDLTGDAMTKVLGPFMGIIVVSIIVVEAGGMDADRFPHLLDHDPVQMTTAAVSQKGLVVILPLSVAAWMVTLVSVSEQLLSLFTVCFGLNISLAVSIFLFHALSNPMVRSLFIMLYRGLRRLLCICIRRRKVEAGSFDSDFKDHDYKLW